MKLIFWQGVAIFGCLSLVTQSQHGRISELIRLDIDNETALNKLPLDLAGVAFDVGEIPVERRLEKAQARAHALPIRARAPVQMQPLGHLLSRLVVFLRGIVDDLLLRDCPFGVAG
jgi:hypothetical protein